MYSTTRVTVEAHPSPDRDVDDHDPAVTSTVRRSSARSSLADRLALRLGMALVIWSRQHGVRLDARELTVALRGEREDRRARQLTSSCRALVGQPPR